MKRLIVNADDFGLTAGVNRAISELNQRRVLTSATLMARASATDQAIESALRSPTLGVGCHVVLVDGRPVLSATKDIPHLADPIDRLFRPTLATFLLAIQRKKVRRLLGEVDNPIFEEIEAETAAQIGWLQSRGLRLTHIDTHKHTHMFPRVLRPVLRAARVAGIRAVRNPFEPQWSLRATPGAPFLRRTQVRLLRTLEPAFRRIVAEEGFTTTNGAIGVLATGTLDSATLTSLLSAMPDGTWELVTHPGYNTADLANAGTRLLASRELELKALTGAAFAADIELIDFGQLTTR